MRQFSTRQTARSLRSSIIRGACCAAVLIVAGCTKPATHDVAYYKAHAAERKQKFDSCTNNPGDGKTDADCTNAIEAERQAELDPNNKRVGSIL